MSITICTYLIVLTPRLQVQIVSWFVQFLIRLEDLILQLAEGNDSNNQLVLQILNDQLECQLLRLR